MNKTKPKKKISINVRKKLDVPEQNEQNSEQNGSTSSAAKDDKAQESPKEASSTPPRPKSSSPEPTCSICLGKLDNKSFTDSCFHMFCFVCLLEWSKVKAVCPLCKQSFTSIIHNVRSIEDYDQYPLQQDQPATDEDRRFRYRTTLTRRRWHELQHMEAERQRDLLHRPTRSYTRLHWGHLRQGATSAYRQRVYANGMRVKEVKTAAGRRARYRDISPAFFSRNAACTHRLIPWLNRELNVLIANHDDHSQFVLELILDLIRRFEIRSEEFRTHIVPFIGRRTEHFIHEFHTFARSPYDMITYDRYALYDEPDPTSQPVYTIDSDSGTDEVDGEGQNVVVEDQDVIVLSGDEGPSRAQPGPFDADHQYADNGRWEPPAERRFLQDPSTIPSALTSYPNPALLAPQAPNTSNLQLSEVSGAESDALLDKVRHFIEMLDHQDTAHSGWESPTPGPSSVWFSGNTTSQPVYPAGITHQVATTDQDNQHKRKRKQNRPKKGGEKKNKANRIGLSWSSNSDSDSDDTLSYYASSHSSDILVVGFEKPFGERTPIQLSSGGEADVVDLSRDDRKRHKKKKHSRRKDRSRSGSRPKESSRRRNESPGYPRDCSHDDHHLGNREHHGNRGVAHHSQSKTIEQAPDKNHGNRDREETSHDLCRHDVTDGYHGNRTEHYHGNRERGQEGDMNWDQLVTEAFYYSRNCAERLPGSHEDWEEGRGRERQPEWVPGSPGDWQGERHRGRVPGIMEDWARGKARERQRKGEREWEKYKEEEGKRDRGKHSDRECGRDKDNKKEERSKEKKAGKDIQKETSPENVRERKRHRSRESSSSIEIVYEGPRRSHSKSKKHKKVKHKKHHKHRKHRRHDKRPRRSVSSDITIVDSISSVSPTKSVTSTTYSVVSSVCDSSTHGIGKSPSDGPVREIMPSPPRSPRALSDLRSPDQATGGSTTSPDSLPKYKKHPTGHKKSSKGFKPSDRMDVEKVNIGVDELERNGSENGRNRKPAVPYSVIQKLLDTVDNYCTETLGTRPTASTLTDTDPSAPLTTSMPSDTTLVPSQTMSTPSNTKPGSCPKSSEPSDSKPGSCPTSSEPSDSKPGSCLTSSEPSDTIAVDARVIEHLPATSQVNPSAIDGSPATMDNISDTFDNPTKALSNQMVTVVTTDSQDASISLKGTNNLQSVTEDSRPSSEGRLPPEIQFIELVTNDSQDEIKSSESVTNGNQPEIKSSESVTNGNQSEIKSSESVTNGNLTEIKSSESVTNGNQSEIKSSESVTNGNQIEIISREVVTNGNQAEIKSSESVTNGNQAEIKSREVFTNDHQLEMKSIEVVTNDNQDEIKSGEVIHNDKEAEDRLREVVANDCFAETKSNEVVTNDNQNQAENQAKNGPNKLVANDNQAEIEPIQVVANNIQSDMESVSSESCPNKKCLGENEDNLSISVDKQTGVTEDVSESIAYTMRPIQGQTAMASTPGYGVDPISYSSVNDTVGDLKVDKGESCVCVLEAESAPSSNLSGHEPPKSNANNSGNEPPRPDTNNSGHEPPRPDANPLSDSDDSSDISVGNHQIQVVHDITGDENNSSDANTIDITS